MQRTLRNETIKTALKTFIVPCLSNKYYIVAFRALWDVEEESLETANLNIWEKRNQLDAIINT